MLTRWQLWEKASKSFKIMTKEKELSHKIK